MISPIACVNETLRSSTGCSDKMYVVPPLGIWEFNMTIKAIYEDGVFKPVEKVLLPEHTEVNVSFPTGGPTDEADPIKRQARLWELLSQRFDGGDPRVAEKHN